RHRVGLRERLLAPADAGGAEPPRDPVRLRARGDDAGRDRRCAPVHRGDRDDLFGLIVLALIVNFTAGMWAAGVAMRLRTIQAGPAMQMPVFIVLFLAPVYVPLDLLAGWVEGVAHVNPFTALVEGGRDFIAGQDFNVWLMFAIAIGLGAAFLV